MSINESAVGVQTVSMDELGAVKARQQKVWASGDYSMIGTTLQIVGETLCEAVDLHAGWNVLDVAAGNGNCTLAAARRFCRVTSTDYVPALLEHGRRRAEVERVAVDFREADAEALDFADGSFDAVLSSFGVMFTPNQERAAREMARVCRPGGRIGLANWTPEGFIGQLFVVIGRHLPPPAGLASPLLWGREEHLARLFGSSVSGIRATRRPFMFRYRSPDHWIDIFRTWYGPTHKAFASLSEDGQQQLERGIRDLIGRFNESGDATMIVPGEYLEVVIEK
ncbi:MAG TPA: class I SAM-dependent methyltransferase [Vicinamibacterales bacterium]|jgi:SAM-dependent methyltransferase